MEPLLIVRLVVLCVIVYFIAANAIFIWRRVQWQKKSIKNKRAVRYMRLTDFIRSCILALAAIHSSGVILLKSNGMSGKRYLCKYFYRWTVYYFIATFFLVIIFVYARLVVVYSCVFIRSSKIRYYMGCLLLIWISGGVVNLKFMGWNFDDNNGVCIIVRNLYLKKIDIAIFVLIWLIISYVFFKPLREVMLITQKVDLGSVERVTSNKENVWRRSYTTSLLSGPNSNETITAGDRILEIENYSKSVNRNVKSWLLMISLSFSWFISYLQWEDKVWYWKTGLGHLQASATLLLLYLSMLSCEKQWCKIFKLC